MAQLTPFPSMDQRVVDNTGAFTPLWRNYFTALDRLIRAGALGPLTSAANDAAAAAAGVPVGALYRTGNAVQIRLV